MNFFISSFSAILWSVVSFGSIYMIFSNVESIAGWNLEEMILMTLVYYVTNVIYRAFFHSNLTKIPELVRDGKMDFVLLMPVDGKFALTTRYVSFSQFLRLVVFLFFFFTYPQKLNPDLNIFTYFLVIFLMAIGIWGMNNLMFIINAYTFWKPRVWNITFIGDRLKQFSQYPADIYSGAVKAFVYIFPLATYATIPTKFLLGRGNWQMIVYSVMLGVTFSLLAKVVWHFGLKKYEGASS